MYNWVCAGEDMGRGMGTWGRHMQVWGMESKCERHKTERSEGRHLTKSPEKKKEQKKEKKSRFSKNLFFLLRW